MEAKKNSLLIVDDVNANIRILTNILGSDYFIYTATDGMEAIEKAKSYMPDIILLDILMPEMDGYETLKVIKKTPVISKIPVIFITGLDSDEDEEKGLSLDAVDYITKPFSQTVVKLRIRNQMQIINQMRMIESMSLFDQLTKLPNRRNFDERLNIEWKQAIREKTPISLLLMDLDKFKQINDIYGHQQGDIVLQTVSSIFTKALKRPGDMAARWGGEEFIILMPNTPKDGAVDIAENIRLKVEETVIQRNDGPKMNVTISIGINSIIPSIDNTIDNFISEADKQLYAAKAAGRNKVSFQP